MSEPLVVAVPSKGRLQEHTLALYAHCTKDACPHRHGR